MKRSGDRVIGRSGDRKNKFTAETRRRGEETVDLVIARDRVTEEKDKTPEIIPNWLFSAPPRLRGESGPSTSRQPGFSPCLRVSVVDFCLQAAKIIRATFREIFDESAYDRFLLRTSQAHSAASYRDFTRERDAAMAKKPRCC
jgi:hypothetical protein